MSQRKPIKESGLKVGDLCLAYWRIYKKPEESGWKAAYITKMREGIFFTVAYYDCGTVWVLKPHQVRKMKPAMQIEVLAGRLTGLIEP